MKQDIPHQVAAAPQPSMAALFVTAQIATLRRENEALQRVREAAIDLLGYHGAGDADDALDQRLIAALRAAVEGAQP